MYNRCHYEIHVYLLTTKRKTEAFISVDVVLNIILMKINPNV